MPETLNLSHFLDPRPRTSLSNQRWRSKSTPPSARLESQELGCFQNVMDTVVSSGNSLLCSSFPPLELPAFYKYSITASFSTSTNTQITFTAFLLPTAKMKFLYCVLPLVSLALANVQIHCPCIQQDCSEAANASRPRSPPRTTCKLNPLRSRPVLAKTRTSSTSISVAVPIPKLPKISVSRYCRSIFLPPTTPVHVQVPRTDISFFVFRIAQRRSLQSALW